MPSDATNEATRRAWRELGFFYERDDSAKEWRIIGSLVGLQAFASALEQYALNARNETLSEHQHFGPYMYLEIGTWTEPQITELWIAGPLRSLLVLSARVTQQIFKANVGDSLRFRNLYAPSSPFELVLQLRDDSYDPASGDPNCW